MSELWRPIPGYDGIYEASDQGRVRSWRNGRWGRNHWPKVLKTSGNGRGYEQLTLVRPDGKHQKTTVHACVAAAFLGPRPEGDEVCHQDGNGMDSRLANLRYDSPAKNQADKVSHGTHNRGVRHYRTSLTEDDVQEIRRSYAAGQASQSQLGAKFGLTQPTVWAIVNR